MFGGGIEKATLPWSHAIAIFDWPPSLRCRSPLPLRSIFSAPGRPGAEWPRRRAKAQANLVGDYPNGRLSRAWLASFHAQKSGKAEVDLRALSAA